MPSTASLKFGGFVRALLLAALVLSLVPLVPWKAVADETPGTTVIQPAAQAESQPANQSYSTRDAKAAVAARNAKDAPNMQGSKGTMSATIPVARSQHDYNLSGLNAIGFSADKAASPTTLAGKTASTTAAKKSVSTLTKKSASTASAKRSASATSIVDPARGVILLLAVEEAVLAVTIVIFALSRRRERLGR